MATVKADNSSFQKEVLDHKGVVIVDFYADWCGPCKVTEPILEELSEKMKDVKFVKVDVDTEQSKSQEGGIMSIPTMVLSKDGKEVDRIVGLASKEAIQSKLSPHLA